MKLRHGTFSYLPDLTDDEIAAQVSTPSITAGRSRSSTPTTRTRATSTGRCGGCRCSTSPSPTACSPRSTHCRATFPQHYVRVLAYDARLGRQTTAMQFLVQRPAHEPGFLLERIEGPDRTQRYAVTVLRHRRVRPGDRYAGG